MGKIKKLNLFYYKMFHQSVKISKSLGVSKSCAKTLVKEKLNTTTFVDNKQFERMIREAAKTLTVSRPILVKKFKINGAFAKMLMQELISRDLIKSVSAQQDLYRGVQAKSAA